MAITNCINNKVGGSNSGATNTLTIDNASNTASSTALLNITVGGTSSGDAFKTYTVSGTTNWSQGVDNSDSDSYVIAASTALGTTNVWKFLTSGEYTRPLQPAFMGFLPSTDTNVTGNGGTYLLGAATALTEVFDQGGDFTTAGVFTAPVNGKYFLHTCMQLGDLLAANTDCVEKINTSNRNIQIYEADVGGGRNATSSYACQGCHLIEMDAADTATFQIRVFNGAADTVDVLGTSGSLERSYCGGFLAV